MSYYSPQEQAATNAKTQGGSPDIAIYGLIVVLLFLSAFPATGTWALYFAIFLMILVWVNAWLKGSLQQVVSTLFQQGSF